MNIVFTSKENTQWTILQNKQGRGAGQKAAHNRK